MSSSSDNPLVRFAAFWWALGVFSLFGVILLAAKLFTRDGDRPDRHDEAAAAIRHEVRATVDAAQRANLGYKEIEPGQVVQVPPRDVFELVGEELLATAPGAIEKPEQIVPGSARQIALADQPAGDFGAVDELTPPEGTAPDPAVLELGKATFAVCMACHGPNGEGGPIGPPLAESEWVTGPVSNLIRIQLRGLEGPISLKGGIYTPIAPMTPLAHQTNEQIAAVLTYIRNSFGNQAPPVLPEQVEMLRSEVGKPMLTEADLIKP